MVSEERQWFSRKSTPARQLAKVCKEVEVQHQKIGEGPMCTKSLLRGGSLSGGLRSGKKLWNNEA